MTDMVHAAMVAAEAGVAKQRLDPAAAFGWQSRPMALSQPAEAKAEALVTLKELVGDPDGSVVSQNRSAYEVTWLERDLATNPLLADCLTVGDAVLLGLPGELFVEYQITAHACRPDKFVATAASPTMVCGTSRPRPSTQREGTKSGLPLRRTAGRTV